MSIRSVIASEGFLHGMTSLAARGATRIARSANAAGVGWRDGRLPLGSRVIGAKRISVGVRFDAAGPVWLEAVSHHAGVDLSANITIGERFTTSGMLHVSAIESIEIGDDCLFGTGVYIGDHAHGAYAGSDQSAPTSPPRDRPLRSAGAIRIGDRVWLGDNVVVLGGVMIGDGAVVGANSVVTRDVPPGSIAVGAPARVAKQWDESAGRWERLEDRVRAVA